MFAKTILVEFIDASISLLEIEKLIIFYS
jgi:hypothetical protein